MAGVQPSPAELAARVLESTPPEGLTAGADLIACSDTLGREAVAVVVFRPAPRSSDDWDVLVNYEGTEVSGSQPVLTPLEGPDQPGGPNHPGRALLTLNHPSKRPRLTETTGVPGWTYSQATRFKLERHFGELATRWVRRNSSY